MTGSLPQSLEGAQAPNALELLWDRYRGLVQGLFWVLAAGLLGYYGLKYYEQKQLNAKWSTFAAATFLHETYSPSGDQELSNTIAYDAVARLLDELRDTPSEKFDQAIATASPEQVPYLMWLQANHAAAAGDLERATQVVDQMRSRFPNHPLVVESDYPVQVREPVKDEKKKDNDKKKKDEPDEPELKPAVKGSMVGLLIDHLKAAKDYVAPAQFKMVEVPADAPRYRITFEGDYGSFVIALMTSYAPKHCAKFEQIAAENFWPGVKVDEIARPGKSRWSDRSAQFHFGFETTKTEANTSDWDKTTPSKEEHVVEEISPLSHFPGAVSARSRDGKSEVDRLYFCANDCVSNDESRQVFAYVVEGLEVVKRITELSFDRSEDEEQGRGLPLDKVVVKSVEKL